MGEVCRARDPNKLSHEQGLMKAKLLEEIAPGVTVEEVQKLTEPALIVRQPVKIMA